jgi:Beta propeller domain
VYTVPQPDGGWATSFAEADRHAIAYFPEKGVLVFPVTDRRRTTLRHRLEVLSVTPTAIAPLGTVEHTAQVWRGVRIDDLLYSVGDDATRIVRIDDPDDVTGTIPF